MKAWQSLINMHLLWSGLRLPGNNLGDAISYKWLCSSSLEINGRDFHGSKHCGKGLFFGLHGFVFCLTTKAFCPQPEIPQWWTFWGFFTRAIFGSCFPSGGPSSQKSKVGDFSVSAAQAEMGWWQQKESDCTRYSRTVEKLIDAMQAGNFIISSSLETNFNCRTRNTV